MIFQIPQWSSFNYYNINSSFIIRMLNSMVRRYLEFVSESWFFKKKLCEISEKNLQFLKVYIEIIKYVIYLSSTQVQITTLMTTHMMQIFSKKIQIIQEKLQCCWHSPIDRIVGLTCWERHVKLFFWKENQ